jgi:hypothetical protein
MLLQINAAHLALALIASLWLETITLVFIIFATRLSA